MFHQSVLSLWDFTIASAAEPGEGGAAAAVHECGIARMPVHGVTFDVTHHPTCPPRHVIRWYSVIVRWLCPVGPRLAHAG